MGLAYLGTRFISTALPPGLDPLAHNVQAITMDRAGALWVSFVNSGVFRLNHGMWSRFGVSRSCPKFLPS